LYTSSGEAFGVLGRAREGKLNGRLAYKLEIGFALALRIGRLQ
jgi:hypothetical protein